MGQNKQLHLFDPRTRGLSEPAKFFFMRLRGLFARKQISKKTLITVFCRYVVSVVHYLSFFFTGTQNLIIFHWVKSLEFRC